MPSDQVRTFSIHRFAQHHSVEYQAPALLCAEPNALNIQVPCGPDGGLA